MGGMRFTVWLHSVRSLHFEARQQGGGCWPTRLRYQNIEIRNTMARPKASQTAWKVSKVCDTWIHMMIIHFWYMLINKNLMWLGSTKLSHGIPQHPAFEGLGLDQLRPRTSSERPKVRSGPQSTYAGGFCRAKTAGGSECASSIITLLTCLSHWIDLNRILQVIYL